MDSQVITQIIISGGLVLVAVLGGVFARRRSSADVEVTLSAEARQWVQDFRASSQEAKTEAREANERAIRAEAQIAAIETRMALMERHIHLLEQIIRDLGGEPPSLPVLR